MEIRLSARKRQGEAAEARFLAEASARGLWVCKPWGDSAPYDFVVDSGKLYRVQVKSVWCRPEHNRRSYTVIVTKGTHGRKKPRVYTAKEVDFVAVLIVQEDAWYIIPLRAMKGRMSAYLGSTTRRSRRLYEKYREAWELLS